MRNKFKSVRTIYVLLHLTDCIKRKNTVYNSKLPISLLRHYTQPKSKIILPIVHFLHYNFFNSYTPHTNISSMKQIHWSEN